MEQSKNASGIQPAGIDQYWLIVGDAYSPARARGNRAEHIGGCRTTEHNHRPKLAQEPVWHTRPPASGTSPARHHMLLLVASGISKPLASEPPWPSITIELCAAPHCIDAPRFLRGRGETSSQTALLERHASRVQAPRHVSCSVASESKKPLSSVDEFTGGKATNPCLSVQNRGTSGTRHAMTSFGLPATTYWKPVPFFVISDHAAMVAGTRP